MKALSKKIMACILMLLMLFSLAITVSAEPEPADSDGTQLNQPQDSNGSGASNATEPGAVTANKITKDDTYQKYMNKYAEAARPKQEIVVDASTYKTLNEDFTPSNETLSVQEFAGIKAVVLPDSGIVAWEVTVPETGLYNMKVQYYNFIEATYDKGDSVVVYKSKSAAINRAIYIDGALPYYEARQVSFSRSWQNQNEMVRDAITDNDIRPFQVELPIWQNEPARDYMGYYSSPLCFYLTKGTHILSFEALRESVAVASITFFQYDEAKDYASIKAQYDANGYTAVPNNEDTFIKIQAENPTHKSDPTLYAIADHSSPLTESIYNGVTAPYNTNKIRLNMIGGEKWQNPGEWLSYTFNVKQAGLYRITLKARQNLLSGTKTYRRLLIDGKEYAKETQAIAFPYGTAWQMVTVADAQGEDMLFYFDEGEHTVRFEVTLGNLTDILNDTQACMDQLNVAYRQILMITGATPDPNRDYRFKLVCADALKIIEEQTAVLTNIEQRVKDTYNGQNTQQTSVLRKMIIILESINKDSDVLKDRFSEFKDNISAMATWINDMRKQPLELDYIVISSPESELPKANVGFFESLWHEIKAFIASFYEDYDNIGSMTEEQEKEAVVVWIETGAGQAGNRDNANVLKELINTSFTKETGIPISLRLVAGGALLPSVLAGNGPDVCLSRGSSDPVNYALRGAVVNLNDPEAFEGCEEVFKQFHESALMPLRFRSGIYGLPETQDFPMLYYRIDILEELGINPDDVNTWDDINKILPILQNKSLNFGMPVPVLGVVGGALSIYATLLYQMGGQLYDTGEYQYDGVTTDLNSDAAFDAFKMWTNMFIVHQVPNSYDFANRFRSGEIPIAIANYSAYNTLSVFAPELDGLWAFKRVPGTVREDGTVDYSTAGSVTACIMLTTAKNRQNAWKFMAWWTGTEAQSLFGREIESMLGSAARYATANLAAAETIPWDTQSFKALQEQWKSVKGIPEVPGSYYTGRNIEFAWKEVINTSSDPSLTFIEYTKLIDDEIARKREEFQEKLETWK